MSSAWLGHSRSSPFLNLAGQPRMVQRANWSGIGVRADHGLASGEAGIVDKFFVDDAYELFGEDGCSALMADDQAGRVFVLMGPTATRLAVGA
jgi:hypothetical protein